MREIIKSTRIKTGRKYMFFLKNNNLAKNNRRPAPGHREQGGGISGESVSG